MTGVTRQFEASWLWLAFAVLLAVVGCTASGKKERNTLAERAPQVREPAPATTASSTLPAISGESELVSRLPAKSTIQLVAAEQDSGVRIQPVLPSEERLPQPVPRAEAIADNIPKDVVSTEDPQAVIDRDRMQIGNLNLSGATDLAFRMQPRLRVYLASIDQARGTADIAHAPYMPMVSGGISGGEYSLNANGQIAGFSFLPPGAVIPIGLNLNSGYGLEDLRMQWLICDFGRRAGRYNQAELGVEVARLQTDRAYQTVANEVAAAYFQLLRADALRLIAREAVRRADDDLQVARKLEKQGAIEHEKTLRAEVQLAQSERLLDGADSATAISVAGLNLAIGVNVSSPTTVVPVKSVPAVPWSIEECLQNAVMRRRELDVARQGVRIAQEGRSVAHADFAPKVVADGALLAFQQANPQADVNLGIGFIKLEWGMFEGGKRVAEMRVADAKLRAAMALAQSIADTISFQITEHYRQMIAARCGIDRSQPAVEQARENYRLVKLRAGHGDATAAELTDAQTALTRAEQDHMTSIYDYLVAISKLEYAMGIAPAASILHSSL